VATNHKELFEHLNPMPFEAAVQMEMDLAEDLRRPAYMVKGGHYSAPRNFEVFTPTDFLAAITQHISDRGAQMVRYCGWYSNNMRGLLQRGLPAELVFRRHRR
jgi:hypothetical protein